MAKVAIAVQPTDSAPIPKPEVLPADGFTRWSGLKAFVPFSRETVRKRELEGRFPRRVHLGSERCAAWPNRALHEWFADPVNYRSGEAA